MWKGDAEDLIERIDKETISPSDFTVELKIRKGCYGHCCGKSYPLKNASSAQILAFVDSNLDSTIIKDPVE